MASRRVTAALAFFFGFTGIHRIYAGDYDFGKAYLAGLTICIILALFGQASWSFFALGLFGFMDFINFVSMSDQAFDHEFNHVPIT